MKLLYVLHLSASLKDFAGHTLQDLSWPRCPLHFITSDDVKTDILSVSVTVTFTFLFSSCAFGQQTGCHYCE
jgi:hypothetical protein